MENKKNNIILLGVIGILTLLFVSLFICFKMTKGKPKKYEPHYDNKIIDKKDDIKDNNDNDNDEEDEDEDNENDECEKYELVYKSSKPISLDYSNLINKFSYETMTRYYCYSDQCRNLEKQLLSYYKNDNPNSKKTSGFADYYVKISNGKLKEAKNGKTTTINGVKNVTSVIANFSVSDGVELFYLDNANNLYYYGNLDNGKKGSKLLYKKVKDFYVFEGNDYISSIVPSEGQNTTIALHTLDNKFMMSYYGYNKFINIKEVDYKLLNSEDGDFINIYLSSSKNNKYEKHDNKEIIAETIFVTKDKIYILNSDNNLLKLDMGSNYCEDNYKLVKKVKDIKFDENKLKANIKFDDDSEQSFDYLKKISAN